MWEGKTETVSAAFFHPILTVWDTSAQPRTHTLHLTTYFLSSGAWYRHHLLQEAFPCLSSIPKRA